MSILALAFAMSDEKVGEVSVDAPRLGYGMKTIANFYGITERKAYHLAPKGKLPGVFPFGDRGWAIHYDVAREGVRARAEGRK